MVLDTEYLTALVGPERVRSRQADATTQSSGGDKPFAETWGHVCDAHDRVDPERPVEASEDAAPKTASGADGEPTADAADASGVAGAGLTAPIVPVALAGAHVSPIDAVGAADEGSCGPLGGVVPGGRLIETPGLAGGATGSLPGDSGNPDAPDTPSSLLSTEVRGAPVADAVSAPASNGQTTSAPRQATKSRAESADGSTDARKPADSDASGGTVPTAGSLRDGAEASRAGEPGSSRAEVPTWQSDARDTDRGPSAEASRASVDTLVAEGAGVGMTFNADGIGSAGDEPPAVASSRVAAHAVVQSVSQRLAEHAVGLRHDGAHSWVVHVDPDEYGAVRVELVLQDHRVTADIVTSHSVVKDLFLHHQGELRDALAEHGLRIDRLSVNVGDPGQQSPNRWVEPGPRFGLKHEGRPEVDSRSNSPRMVESVGAPWTESGVWQAVNVYV
jgi:hypothetical protein